MLRLAKAVAVLHLVVASVHGAAHFGLGVFLPPLGTGFAVVVIYLAPVVALALLRHGRVGGGSALLSASLFGSLLFGAYHHFMAISGDHVGHLPAGDWRLAFQVTAVLLLPIDALGTIAGLWAYSRRD